MITGRTAAASRPPLAPLRFDLAALVIVLAALTFVIRVVAHHTVAVVESHHLLPLWDLATHLGHGWLDYHLLVTGQIPGLLWDLWMQGYWPPAMSIFQIPFYLILGGGMTSGLWSALVAFALAALTGVGALWRQWKHAATLPASLFLALLVSSPFLLAYASVTMTEVPGALAQLLVVLSYATYRDDPGPRTARWFAISLTVLFFTKYNYFVLLAAPLALYEWLERTQGWSATRRLTGVWRWTRRFVSTPAGVLLVLYAVVLAIVVRTGGFDTRVLGQRVSVHGIGNSGHIVLYVLLARLWYLHHRGRIDWARLASIDPRVRPLFFWFAVPVAIWLASPYPNHIRDVFNLVINRPLDDSTVGEGLATYLAAIRMDYFYSGAILASVVGVFVIAAVRYRRQPPLMRWLVLTIPLQFAAVAFHQTRLTRFLVPTVVLLCLTASAEIGGWIAGSRRARLAASLLAPVVLGSGVIAATRVVSEPRFTALAFENYIDNEGLRVALGTIRRELTAEDRLAIVGQSNELSPALFRWELGPPSGVACFPFEAGGAQGISLALATRVLLLMPLGAADGQLDATSPYLAQRREVLERSDRGELVLRREIALTDMGVGLRIYDRASRPEREAPCR